MVMKPMKALLSLEEAMEILMRAVSPIERTETVPIASARGRVLASDLVAAHDVPPFPRAAMDGYAVVAEDTFPAGQFSPVSLALREVIHAGETATRPVERGVCIQVATGSPMPRGADAVVMVEDTEATGETVAVYKPVYPRQNVSPQGEDITTGTVVLRAGTHLTPSKIGAAAALGIPQVEVYALPKVAVIPSGNEIVPLGQPLTAGKIHDINSYTLATLIEESGGIPTIYPIMTDTADSIMAAIRKALVNDLIVISGGSSVGERDMMVEVVEKMGELKFHGIAVKPGKPTLCGIVEGKLLLGMPGYPTSCLTNGYGILVPLLEKMARLPGGAHTTVQAPMARRYTSTMGRHQYLPVKIEGGMVVPVFKESGAITSMANADGYIEIPANVDLVEKGELVTVILF